MSTIIQTLCCWIDELFGNMLIYDTKFYSDYRTVVFDDEIDWIWLNEFDDQIDENKLFVYFCTSKFQWAFLVGFKIQTK